jgi:cytidylate kinase
MIPAEKKYQIAIDGPAASGKSTTAQRVARILGYLYIDSGAMYRALTYYLILEKVNSDDEEQIVALARRLDIRLDYLSDKLRTLIDGKDVTAQIRHPQVDELISKISAYRGVRNIMVEKQRRLAAAGGIVMDGRDIGTVVLPDAEIKIFMDADLKNRAQRRYEELQRRGIKSDIRNIEKEIKQRDRLDSSREIAPLKKAGDAHIIDTSCLSIDQQVEKVLELVRNRQSSDRAASI